MGQVKKLISVVKATRASSRGSNTTDGSGMQPKNSWRGGSRGRGLPRQTHPRTTPQPRARDSQSTQGVGPTTRCWQWGEMGHYRRECPNFKRRRAVQTGECLNSPRDSKRHSPVSQPTLNTTREKGAHKLATKKKNIH